MNHKFCVHCAAKNYYESSAPKFCSGCGKELAGESVEATTESFCKENLKEGWDVESQPIQRETVGQAIFSHGTPRNSEHGERPNKFEGKDVLKETLKECGRVNKSKGID